MPPLRTRFARLLRDSSTWCHHWNSCLGLLWLLLLLLLLLWLLRRLLLLLIVNCCSKSVMLDSKIVQNVLVKNYLASSAWGIETERLV